MNLNISKKALCQDNDLIENRLKSARERTIDIEKDLKKLDLVSQKKSWNSEIDSIEKHINDMSSIKSELEQKVGQINDEDKKKEIEKKIQDYQSDLDLYIELLNQIKITGEKDLDLCYAAILSIAKNKENCSEININQIPALDSKGKLPKPCRQLLINDTNNTQLKNFCESALEKKTNLEAWKEGNNNYIKSLEHTYKITYVEASKCSEITPVPEFKPTITEIELHNLEYFLSEGCKDSLSKKINKVTKEKNQCASDKISTCTVYVYCKLQGENSVTSTIITPATCPASVCNEGNFDDKRAELCANSTHVAFSSSTKKDLQQINIPIRTFKGRQTEDK